jgi:hypothetical protein
MPKKKTVPRKDLGHPDKGVERDLWRDRPYELVETISLKPRNLMVEQRVWMLSLTLLFIEKPEV